MSDDESAESCARRVILYWRLTAPRGAYAISAMMEQVLQRPLDRTQPDGAFHGYDSQVFDLVYTWKYGVKE